MFAVIFEVQPKKAEFDRYLEIAGSLRPELDGIGGFVAIERFRSRRRPERVLSLSIWQDEAAVARWRGFAAHRQAQQLGRSEIFADYRLRVGEITADSGTAGSDPAAGAGGGNVTIGEWSDGEGAVPADRGLTGGPAIFDAEQFDSIYHAGKRLILVSWRDDSAAGAWRLGGEARVRRVRIIRDYGMFERGQAP